MYATQLRGAEFTQLPNAAALAAANEREYHIVLVNTNQNNRLHTKNPVRIDKIQVCTILYDLNFLSNFLRALCCYLPTVKPTLTQHCAKGILLCKMKVKIELSGGLELLFAKVKEHKVDLPDDVRNMRSLIKWMQAHLLTERPELFVSGETVRPGVLVLINDADWELDGQLDYKLQEGDSIAFISTLHGG